MPRSQLASIVRQLFQTSKAIRQTGLPASAIEEERAQRRIQRREFLGNTLRAAAVTTGVVGGLTTAGSLRTLAAGTAPSVVIVGAGLAGLSCAYKLSKRGISASVYEAATRLGGRCLTRRGYFNDNQQIERGGELIDTGHKAVRQLAKALGLRLDDVLAAPPANTEVKMQFAGQSYSFAQATQDFLQIFPILDADVNAAGYPTTYESSTPRGVQLDNLSIADYIDQVVPGGHNSPLGQLLDVAYNIEFGAETSDQSALNLLYLLGYSSPRKFEIFGESDERFHIRGGNDQLVSGMAAHLDGQIELGHELTAIAECPDGRTELTFTTDSCTKIVRADHVVLALPFSILRHSVDLSRAGFSPLKHTAIAQQGFGNNCKLQLQFTDRHWYSQGCNGETYADTGYQLTWEASRAQAGASGILNNFTGGNIALGQNRPINQLANEFLTRVEPVLPGLSSRYNGKVSFDYWPGYRWTRGSYSYWRVGQYTQFAGYEGVQERTIHFCGEHTSMDFQGFLNGAVESGESVAKEILRQI